ncbi:hypothetical protein [Eubacterium sp. AF17-7]|uniref:hypothetical protein n=1 Tax=Eubacterium sp. AF17-7 TaxID=2293105 RepID=UPI001314E9D3|nr:hypothetical protein [Eubacterium sp. AF17-7]
MEGINKMQQDEEQLMRLKRKCVPIMVVISIMVIMLVIMVVVIYLIINHKVIFDYLFKSSYMPV